MKPVSPLWDGTLLTFVRFSFTVRRVGLGVQHVIKIRPPKSRVHAGRQTNSWVVLHMFDIFAHLPTLIKQALT
jgi:hypothetical protein